MRYQHIYMMIYLQGIYGNQSQQERNHTTTKFRGHEARSQLRILLINVEAFVTKKIFKFLDTFTHRSNFLVGDESTTIKNIKAKRTKALMFLPRAKYKRILTGSPITKSPLDLYSQFLFLDKKILGFDSYWSFQGRYAVLDP